MQFEPAEVRARRGRDGAVYLHHPRSLRPPARNLVEFLHRCVQKYAARSFLHEREGGGWRSVTYREFGERVAKCAGALQRMDVGSESVVAILARNSIDHAVANFAAMALGAAVAPLSPAYVAQPGGLSLLADLCRVVGARCLLVDAGLAGLAREDFPSVVVLPDLIGLAQEARALDLKLAASRLGAGSVAKIFFTSGSTGSPKPVANTHRMLVASAAMVDAVSPRLPNGNPPIVVDWLPWHHTYGGNINLHSAMIRGGAFYIDDGLPTEALFGRTLRNLAEVQPTQITNVPIAYPMLIDALRRDEQLALRVLKNVRVCSFGGAALSPSVLEAFQALAVETIGERIAFGSGYGMTETGGIIALTYWLTDRPELLGLPLPGETLKLVPCDDGRYECRVSGPHVFGGYLDGASAPFDEEAYFRTGDAVRPAQPGTWSEGLVYDGRLAEDFKLSSGVWVRAGPMREALLDALRPHAAHILLCGANRNGVGALVWLAPGASSGTLHEVRARAERFNVDRSTPSTRVARLAVAGSPPAPEELTAKGTINMARATVSRREEIDALFANLECAL